MFVTDISANTATLNAKKLLGTSEDDIGKQEYIVGTAQNNSTTPNNGNFILKNKLRHSVLKKSVKVALNRQKRMIRTRRNHLRMPLKKLRIKTIQKQ